LLFSTSSCYPGRSFEGVDQTRRWFIRHEEMVGSGVKYKGNGSIESYKVRLVAKGFTQTYGINY